MASFQLYTRLYERDWQDDEFFKPRSLDTEFVFVRHSILVPPQGYLFFCHARIQRKTAAGNAHERKRKKIARHQCLFRLLSFGACGINRNLDSRHTSRTRFNNKKSESRFPFSLHNSNITVLSTAGIQLS